MITIDVSANDLRTANRLNPSYTELLFRMVEDYYHGGNFALPRGDGRPPEGWRDQMLKNGFTLYRATPVPLYETATTTVMQRTVGLVG